MTEENERILDNRDLLLLPTHVLLPLQRLTDHTRLTDQTVTIVDRLL